MKVSTIYVVEQGVKITKQSRRVVICREKEILLELPEFQIERVVVFGNVHITTPALQFFLDNGIDVAFLTLRGKYRGRLISRFSKNIFLRLEAFKLHQDKDYCLRFARNIVKGKLERIKENVKDKDFIQNLMDSLERKQSLNSIRGVEGIGTAVYFREISTKIPEEYRFEKRIVHPSPDIVNASLSFGYTLLTNEFISLIETHGLDPHLGIFHQINYGRPSLALDLVEEFRIPVVDKVILKILKLRCFKDRSEKIDEKGQFRLDEEEVKVLIAEYEEEAEKWREIFRKQIEYLVECINRKEVYNPYVLRCKL